MTQTATSEREPNPLAASPPAPAEPPPACQVCGAAREPQESIFCRVCGEPVIAWGWAP